MIAIIEYGVGNCGSIGNMLRKLGHDAVITGDPVTISRADKLILPGIGAFDTAMQKLSERNLVPLLNERILSRGVPILGICLGMQLFGCGSEEGSTTGLGWIKARSARFRFESPSRLKVPHMGWSSVSPSARAEHTLALTPDARFYFVHSYHMVCSDPSDVLATCEYGKRFTAAVQRGNIIGVQFHPEKSHKFGLRVLRTFADAV